MYTSIWRGFMKFRSMFLWIVVFIFLLSPINIYAENDLSSEIDQSVYTEVELLSDIDENTVVEDEPLSDIDKNADVEDEPVSDIDKSADVEDEPSDIDANVEAEDDLLSDLDKTRIAGDLITSVMDLVMDQFVGDDVSPEFLYESALRGMMISLDPYSQYLSSDELDRLQKSFSGKMHAIGITLDATDTKVTVINERPPRWNTI